MGGRAGSCTVPCEASGAEGLSPCWLRSAATRASAPSGKKPAGLAEDAGRSPAAAAAADTAAAAASAKRSLASSSPADPPGESSCLAMMWRTIRVFSSKGSWGRFSPERLGPASSAMGRTDFGLSVGLIACLFFRPISMCDAGFPNSEAKTTGIGCLAHSSWEGSSLISFALSCAAQRVRSTEARRFASSDERWRSFARRLSAREQTSSTMPE
mmetsp:Transcript_65352/g.147441  ORF Transcript_65352/g.147441 Transcript_65352/m.147441 type:complete len:213 (-) Transcript_65352:204-842(-)